ncbi:MAG: hypothetical protein Q9227_008897 [Pyrenula ochraceoflavens]
MSGNPFRRKDNNAVAAASRQPVAYEPTNAGERFPSLDTTSSTTRASPKPKTVRIASPEVPTSPYSAYYFSDSSTSSPVLSRSVTRSDSPPPPQVSVSGDGEDSPADPFNTEASDGEEAESKQEVIVNTASNAGSVAKRDQVIEDPVRNTLAKFASRPKSIASESLAERSNVSRAGGQQRQTMDVDAFKRLLLTGDASLQPKETPPPVTSPHHGVVSDSSSNTDTASISRQSIFEPMPALATDTPRTSHELSPEDADEERAKLMGEGPPTRKKPPPPRTRHGKLIKNTLPSPPQPAPQSPTQPHASHIPTGSPSANLNKPLPEPPFQDPWVIPGQSSEEPAGTPTPASSKRPPTPPISRRKSQIKKNDSYQNPPNSNSSTLSTTESVSSTSLQKQRPPPPTRRSYVAASPNETTSPYEEIPPTHSPNEEDLTNPNPAPARPPLPASRQSSSGKRPTPRQSKNAAAAPPPPPPRKLRGSSRSSFDTTRASIPSPLEETTLTAAGRRPSAETDRSVSGSSQANDILADLAALQREVDDLRNSHQTRKGSSAS